MTWLPYLSGLLAVLAVGLLIAGSFLREE